MSKSLEFCKARAMNPDISSYSDRNWDCTAEEDPTPIIDIVLRGARKYTVTGHLDDSTEVEYHVNIEINPDAEFDYFTSDSFISDGTLLFLAESYDKILRRVVSIETYNKELGPPRNGCTVHYVIGNLVRVLEYDGNWIPEDRPFLRERTTVFLPLKVWYE